MSQGCRCMCECVCVCETTTHNSPQSATWLGHHEPGLPLGVCMCLCELYCDICSKGLKIGQIQLHVFYKSDLICLLMHPGGRLQIILCLVMVRKFRFTDSEGVLTNAILWDFVHVCVCVCGLAQRVGDMMANSSPSGQKQHSV